jgi:hypothetical protein
MNTETAALPGGPAAPALSHKTARRTPPEFLNADKLLCPAMLLCGFFFWEWIMESHGEAALGVFLFTALLCGFTLAYYRAAGVKQSRGSLAAFAVVCVSTLNFLVFDTTDLSFLNFVFLASAFLYWAAASTGTKLAGGLTGLFLGDMLGQWVTLPFSNIALLFSGLHASIPRGKRGRGILGGLAGLLIFLPILFTVGALLIEADDAFSELMDTIFAWINLSNCLTWLFKFLMGIPVACWLYGVIYGGARKRSTDVLSGENLTRGLLRARVSPLSGLCAPLAVLNLLYLLFFAALGAYFFSAFTGVLPETLTYAEYARKGFFELCGVASINLAMLSAAYIFVKRDGENRPAVLRFLTGLMSLLTLLLIATAMSKMLLYISSYGLTRLRVAVTWFLALLFIVFLLLILWHIKRINLAKPLIICCVAAFMALTWADTDAIIARHNLLQYENGQLAELDYFTLSGLSAAAAPAIYEAWERAESPDEKEALRQSLLRVGQGYADMRLLSGEARPDGGEAFTKWNLQTLRAEKLRAAVIGGESDAALE